LTTWTNRYFGIQQRTSSALFKSFRAFAEEGSVQDCSRDVSTARMQRKMSSIVARSVSILRQPLITTFRVFPPGCAVTVISEASSLLSGRRACAILTASFLEATGIEISASKVRLHLRKDDLVEFLKEFVWILDIYVSASGNIVPAAKS